MQYSQSPPLAEKEWQTAEARDLDAISDQRIGKRPAKPSNHSSRAFSLKHDQVASDRPPVGRRIFRAVSRFLIVVLIGVGGTLAWQSYGDAAREIVIVRAPTLAWLLSVSTTKSPAVAATSPAPVQQLEPLASNLDVVRRSIEQLAAKQDQMAQNIASLQAVEEEIRQKISFAPPSTPPQAAPIPSLNPHNPGRSHRLCSHRRYLARRLLPDHSYSRVDGTGCPGNPAAHWRRRWVRPKTLAIRGSLCPGSSEVNWFSTISQRCPILRQSANAHRFQIITCRQPSPAFSLLVDALRYRR